MRKLTLSLLLLIGVGLSASAQRQLKFGVKGGVSLSNFDVSTPETSGVNTSNNTSFYLGGTVNIPISRMFFVQPGILFIGKGAKEKTSFSATYDGLTYGQDIDSKISPFYIEIPVNLMANFANKKGNFLAGVGPYYAIGVAGKIKYDGTETNASQAVNVKIHKNIKFGDTEDSEMKRGDFGINFLLGYQWNSGFGINLGYDLGLSNIDSSDEKGVKIKNTALTAGIGFTF